MILALNAPSRLGCSSLAIPDVVRAPVVRRFDAEQPDVLFRAA